MDTISDPYSLVLLALCVWREARGESYEGKQGVAWTIRNRVALPRWWGHSFVSCILLPYQFSSFNRLDPNATKWPLESDPSWNDALDVAKKVIANPPTLADNTGGATSYFDSSIEPPTWATDGSNEKTVEIGRLSFYKLA